MREQSISIQGRWLWPVLLVLVTLLAFGLRWYFVSTARVFKPMRGDTLQYMAYAWNLIHHGVFSNAAKGAAEVLPNSYRDPGYPLMLGVWMKLLGQGPTWYAVVLMFQALLGALTVTLAMLLGRYWLPVSWVAGAGVLMAVWPHSVTIDAYLLSETLFGFLCALALLLSARACALQSTGWAIAAGLAFGAAALTNAVLLPLGVMLAIYLAWRKLVRRKVWVALLAAAIVLPGAWAIRNSQLPIQQGNKTSTDRALQNLVQGSWPVYHAAWRVLVEDKDMRGKRVLDAIQSEYELLRDSPAQGAHAILHRLGQRPWHFAAWYIFEKPRLLWGWRIRISQQDIYVYPTVDSPFVDQVTMRVVESVCRALNPWLAGLALIGIIAVFSRAWRAGADEPRANAAPQIAAFLLVFVTLVYTALQAEPRYSIPYRAFEILLAITACHGLLGLFHQYREKQALQNAHESVGEGH